MTPIPDNIAEAVDELEDAVIDYADCGAEMGRRKYESRARLDALILEVVAERDRYQELRKLIDGGSESMTHVDALSTIGQLQEALEERDGLRGQLAGMYGVLVACLLLVDEHSDCLTETLNRVMRDERRTKRAQAEITDNDELRARIKDAIAVAQEQPR